MRYLFIAFKERTVERLVHGEEKNKKVTTFFVLGVTFLFFASAGTPAKAETLSPWWHITSGSRPSNIQPGAVADEVRQWTVNASSGNYELKARTTEGEQEVQLGVGEKPEEVQTRFEELYGAGNVEVTSPCTTVPNPACTKALNEYEVYELKFIEALAHRNVGYLERASEQLTGGSETVTIKQISEGRPDGVLVVTVENEGDAPADASKAPVTILDNLPAGLKATGAVAIVPRNDSAGSVPCSFESTGSRVSCKLSGKSRELPGVEKSLGGLPPYQAIEVRIPVETEPSAASGELNEVSVTGGEAPDTTIKRPIVVNDAPPLFGVEDYELTPEEPGGTLDTQAGSHPFETNFTTVLNQEIEEGELSEGRPLVRPVALAKDLRFKLPPGLVGDPTAIPQCTIGQFLDEHDGHDACAADMAVGVATVTAYASGFGGYVSYTQPVFNLEPQPGEPARFGFDIPTAHFGVYIDTSVRTGGDYGVTSVTSNIPQISSFISAAVTLWGTPGDARHNYLRGWGCLAASEGYTGIELLEEYGPCAEVEAVHPAAFLDLPTSCTGPLQSSVEADSWVQAGHFTEPLPATGIPALDGCNKLAFAPEIKVTPDGQQASKPTGLDVDVHVPQEGQLDSEGLAQSNVKNITVTLPPGMILNPSAANGLEGCSGNPGDRPGSPGNLVGYEGSKELPSEPGVDSPLFSPYVPESIAAHAAGDQEPLEPGKNFCPDASKVAEATIKTPLLPNPVKGFVYLASPQNFNSFPQENPFGKHVAMYIVAEDPVSGSLVKLPGRVELGGEPGVEGLAAGQIRSTFEDNPQLPFEDAELHFFGGERAPLASPTHCGSYTTNATFTPWSGGNPVNSSSTFQITSGPNGSPCPGAALPFSPELHSSVSDINAGGFTPLSTTISRPDGDQAIQSVTLHYPPGLSGILTGVPLCGEAEANAGTCSSASEIGETIVSVGVGGDPFTVTGGKAYLTGPYQGAPFGLSIVNPAKAGPFDLQEGRPVVVRAKIEVNPITAALTITTDPSGAHAIPTLIEGFPLQIQHVNVLVNRAGFTFNPTSCSKMEVTGTIASAEGASSEVKDPFQVTNCASLKFAPKFSVSTLGKTSRLNGASLNVHLAYPSASFGSQANIRQVKVELPKGLPSKLKTLQKACTAAQFHANPAGCPAASIVGHAKAVTPLIPVPLEGPAYFVSNGGEAFPNLTIVLQGYGVTIDLVGDTFISKAGVTSSTFKTVPDAPVGSFELTLPEGPYSALTADGDLCRQKLVMPTEFVAQNGAEIHEATKVAVTGCPRKAKKAPKGKGKSRRHRTRGKGAVKR